MCFPDPINYTCSDQHFHRASLACNGNRVVDWARLGDCKHATGCDENGCRPKWEVMNEFAQMVTHYRFDYCEQSPPRPPAVPPPSPLPPRGWCEQLQSSHTWSPVAQHQPANALTSLAGVLLGGYGLSSREADDHLGLHRSVCCLMAITGLGSALHHWFPLAYWSHAADFVPMLMLACAGLIQAIRVLAIWLSGVSSPACCLRKGIPGAAPSGQRCPRPGRDGVVLLIGWCVTVCAMLSYSVRRYDAQLEDTVWGVGSLGPAEMLVGVIVGQVMCHALLLGALLWRARRRRRMQQQQSTLASPEGASPHPHDAKDVYKIAQVYLAVAVSLALAAPAQRIEHGQCPTWLFESRVSVHGVWHCGIFFAVYHVAALLHYLETPGGVWQCAFQRCPWLLFRCAMPGAAAHSDHERRASAKGELDVAI